MSISFPVSISFIDQLAAETAAERAEFQAIPIIRHALANGVERDLYLRFLASAYHHVRYTCPLMGLALSRCGEADGALRAGLLAYLEEEKGHEEWILDDIADLGGDRDAVRNALAPLPVRAMVAYAHYAVEHLSPYTLLGMVHVLEGMSVALATTAARSIMTAFGSEPGAEGRAGAGDHVGGFRYLTSHGALDTDHIAFFAGLLARIDTPERRALVVQAAKDFYRLYGDVFRELSHAA